jgi:hypothetical protein
MLDKPRLSTQKKNGSRKSRFGRSHAPPTRWATSGAHRRRIVELPERIAVRRLEPARVLVANRPTLAMHRCVPGLAQYAGDRLHGDPPAEEPLELGADLRRPHRRVLLLVVEIALTSCSPSPAPGSCGALVVAGSATAGFVAADESSLLRSRLLTLVTSPCFLPSAYHRRSDSVVQPIVLATCSRLIPSSISDSARACSAGENLRLRAGTRSRLRPRELDFETPLLLRDE